MTKDHSFMPAKMIKALILLSYQHLKILNILLKGLN